MSYPPLIKYKTTNEYRQHYELIYCLASITTFDGIEVRFRKDRFNHCFFESSKRNNVKDRFSRIRSERIDWIQAALKDPEAELFVGWDRKRKKFDMNHRVAVVVQNYVVVIRITGEKKAQFVTAYLADSASTISRIRRSPRWKLVEK